MNEENIITLTGEQIILLGRLVTKATDALIGEDGIMPMATESRNLLAIYDALEEAADELNLDIPER